MTTIDELQPIWTNQYHFPNKDDTPIETAQLKLYEYSDKSVALTTGENFGRAFSYVLKGIGKYNANLKVGKGWVFPISKYDKLQKLLDDIIAGTIQAQQKMPSLSSLRLSDPLLDKVKEKFKAKNEHFIEEIRKLLTEYEAQSTD